ncbi:hypothetical protein GA0115242_135737 [Streptomyces sp. SolWspMP-5a-2]|jgi:hypothetical protein|nr:hypothetical protein GA0115242_135737 [Streptomyces sp. SolWspMP-5a-2]
MGNAAGTRGQKEHTHAARRADRQRNGESQNSPQQPSDR